MFEDFEILCIYLLNILIFVCNFLRFWDFVHFNLEHPDIFVGYFWKFWDFVLFIFEHSDIFVHNEVGDVNSHSEFQNYI